MKKFTAKKLAVTALFMALTMVATLFIRIPLPIGYVNLGDAFVFLSGFLLGPFWGAFAAGVGSALADLFGYVTYAPATLLIKTLMAVLAALIYQMGVKWGKYTIFLEIAAGVVGALVMAFGYFLYETWFFTTAAVALVNVWWNLLQGGAGVVISVLVMRLIKATKLLERLKT